MSHGSSPAFILTDYAKKLIRIKARQLSHRRDFHDIACTDLEQELWLALVKAARQFNPAKASLDTFIDRVVNTAVAMLVRARQRIRHDGGRPAQSLSDELISPHGKPEPLAHKISPEDLARRIGTARRDESAVAETTEAVATALESMPDDLRDLCRRLMHSSIAAVARDLGLSRRQLRKRLEELRPFLEAAR